MWQSSKIQIVTKLKNSNYDKTQNSWNGDSSDSSNSDSSDSSDQKTLKKKKHGKTLKYSNLDKTQKIKMWQNSKTQNLTTEKLKM